MLNRYRLRPSGRPAAMRLVCLEDRLAPASFPLPPPTRTRAGRGTPGGPRHRLNHAHSAKGADPIPFSPTVFNTARTITLTAGTLNVSDSVVVNGPGKSLVTVDGNNATALLFSYSTSVISVTFTDMT